MPSAAPRKGGETNTCQVTKNCQQFKTTHLCIWVCQFADMFRETVLILQTLQGKPGSLQNLRSLSQFACWLLGSPDFLAPWQPAWKPWTFAKCLGAHRLLWILPFWQLWKNSSLARLSWNHFPGCLGSSRVRQKIGEVLKLADFCLELEQNYNTWIVYPYPLVGHGSLECEGYFLPSCALVCH